MLKSMLVSRMLKVKTWLLFLFVFFFGNFWPQVVGVRETRTRNLRFMIFVVVMVAVEKGGDMR